MTDRIISALSLPADARVDQRVPKKTLAEQGAKSKGDRKALLDGIEEFTWVAALKPETIGVPSYRDATREYLEIAVLRTVLRAGVKRPRVVELIHRAIPYPVFLVVAHDGENLVSLAHKRFSQAENEAFVVDQITTGTVADGAEAFLASLPLTRQPHTNMHALYDGWNGCLQALLASRITGTFVTRTAQDSAERQALLSDYEAVVRQLASITAEATKEKQMARRVELNLEIQRLNAQLAELKEKL